MGAYKSEKTNAGLVLYMKGDSIYSLTNGWLQISFQPNTLLAGRGHITFTSSKPRKAILVTASGDTLQYIGVEPADTSEKTLEEYVGSYYSQDADVNMKVVLKKGKLVCFTREGREEILKPVYKDGFGFDGGDIFIDRDKQGKINTLYISISRARKVPFSRIP